MQLIRKTLVLGCALAIAACAQSGLNLTPSGVGTGGVPLGRVHRGSGPSDPGIYVFQGERAHWRACSPWQCAVWDDRRRRQGRVRRLRRLRGRL